MSKQRKFRVSVFPSGTIELGSTPLHHHCCQSQRSAEEHFLKYIARRDGPGRDQHRVVLHQGDLRGTSYKTLLDSYWFEHYRREQRAKAVAEWIEDKRCERGE